MVKNLSVKFFGNEALNELIHQNRRKGESSAIDIMLFNGATKSFTGSPTLNGKPKVKSE